MATVVCAVGLPPGSCGTAGAGSPGCAPSAAKVPMRPMATTPTSPLYWCGTRSTVL